MSVIENNEICTTNQFIDKVIENQSDKSQVIDETKENTREKVPNPNYSNPFQDTRKQVSRAQKKNIKAIQMSEKTGKNTRSSVIGGLKTYKNICSEIFSTSNNPIHGDHSRTPSIISHYSTEENCTNSRMNALQDKKRKIGRKMCNSRNSSVNYPTNRPHQFLSAPSEELEKTANETSARYSQSIRHRESHKMSADSVSDCLTSNTNLENTKNMGKGLKHKPLNDHTNLLKQTGATGISKSTHGKRHRVLSESLSEIFKPNESQKAVMHRANPPYGTD